MNQEIRNYIVRKLQPWRGLVDESPSELKPFEIDPTIEDYFKRYFSTVVSPTNVEGLFEVELIAIYSGLVECLPDDWQAYFQQNVAFGACFASKTTTFVTKIDGKYAILWDFWFDTFLTQPTTLFSMISTKFIDQAAAICLMNISVAVFSTGRGCYRDPAAARSIDRKWINHMVWGMTMFGVAHEISHITLGHLDGRPLDPMPVMTRQGDLIVDVKEFNVSQQMEFQADMAAIDLLVQGIDSGRIKGYDLFNESPYDGLYQHVGWMLSLFEISDDIKSQAGIPLSTTHPEPSLRRKVALGHLLSLKGDQIQCNESADGSWEFYCSTCKAFPAYSFETEEGFRDFVLFQPGFRPFYLIKEHIQWMKDRGLILSEP